jgi:hypothetical protein
VSILRFQGCSPRLCQLRTTQFWPRWQALSCVLTTCRVLWGLISQVAFITTMSNRTSLLCVVLLLFWRENEAEGQDFIPGAGARFQHSRDLRMVVIRESLQESSVWCVGQVLSPAGCISIRVAATLSVMNGSLSLQSSHSMSGVLLVDSSSWIWSCSRLLYHYVIAYL